MKPFALIIVISILIGVVFVLSPVSSGDIFASLPLFQTLDKQTNNNINITPLSQKRAQIFRSIDRGVSWFPQVSIDAEKNIPEIDILDMMIDSDDPNIIWIGTNGDGLYRSINNGQNWEKTFDKNGVLLNNAIIHKVLQDPQDIKNIYIAATQDSYGVFLKSIDGGMSFTRTYISQLQNYPLLAIAISPTSSNIIYTGTAQGGFFVSRDFGETWKVAAWITGRITDIIINPDNPSNIYLVTSDRGLFHSNDKGENWKNFSHELARISARNLVMMFLQNPLDLDTLYLALSNGLVVSHDKGKNWKFVNILVPPHILPVDAVAIDPLNSNNIYVGVGSLLYASVDGGVEWSVLKLNTQKRIAHILIDSKDPANIFLGMKNPPKR